MSLESARSTPCRSKTSRALASGANRVLRASEEERGHALLRQVAGGVDDGNRGIGHLWGLAVRRRQAGARSAEADADDPRLVFPVPGRGVRGRLPGHGSIEIVVHQDHGECGPAGRGIAAGSYRALSEEYAIPRGEGRSLFFFPREVLRLGAVGHAGLSEGLPCRPPRRAPGARGSVKEGDRHERAVAGEHVADDRIVPEVEVAQGDGAAVTDDPAEDPAAVGRQARPVAPRVGVGELVGEVGRDEARDLVLAGPEAAGRERHVAARTPELEEPLGELAQDLPGLGGRAQARDHLHQDGDAPALAEIHHSQPRQESGSGGCGGGGGVRCCH